MFKAKIDNSKKLFSDCLQAIGAVCDETTFVITEQSISTKMVDPSNTTMVSMEMSCSIFSEYSATEQKIAVDIKKLLGFVNGMETEIDIELDEKEHRLKLSNDRKKYSMALLDPTSIRKPPKVPNLDEGYIEAEITGADFKDFVSMCSAVGGYVSIGVKDNVFFAECVEAIDTARFELPGYSGDCVSLFSLVFLQDFVKVLKNVPDIKIGLHTDYPLKMLFSLADGVEGMYLLAPRVESE